MELIKEKVNTVILEIQSQNNVKMEELKEDHRISKDLGFSSLDVAQLIATLEMELGVDPFAENVALQDVNTLGKLYNVYQEAIVLAEVAI